MSGHIAPKSMYFGIFGALMVATILTVAVTYVHLGTIGNLAVALLIAVTKALLVISFFMHVKYSPKIIKVTAGLGFFFFIIMVMFTMSDYLSRGQMGLPQYPTAAAVGTASMGMWQPAKVVEPETAAEKTEANAVEHEKAAKPQH